MNQQSIDAYSMPQRVASYDANMELMHPNRSKMVQVALEILPFPKESPLKALDLGIGTGYFTEKFLRCYPHATVVAIDGAKAMTEMVDARLGNLASQVDVRVADFRQLDQIGLQQADFDVVFSSYALHHLNREEKQRVVAQAMRLLKAGGWFVNADLIVADSPQMEERIQQLRIQGILDRVIREDVLDLSTANVPNSTNESPDNMPNGSNCRFIIQTTNPQFRDAATTRAYLDEIERQDGDQPQSLLTDLQILREAGVRYASVFWLEYREAVIGGQR
jgi:tRNA (cmo5U34)-methyltransferase